MKQNPNRIQPAEPKTALSLANLALDFMLQENGPDCDPLYKNELTAAKITINRMINRPDPGPFFLSAAGRRRRK